MPRNGPRPLNWKTGVGLVVAGALQTLTFSPFQWWWLGPISLLLVLYLCLPLERSHMGRAGWLMGLGLFGSGASWVYISIHTYGMASAPLGALLTLIFIAGLALFPTLAFWLWGRLACQSTAARLVIFPGIWVLADWLRSWFLTGFPWLYLGTAQVDGPLGSWAPVLGVHGVTFLIAASATTLFATILYGRAQARTVAAGTAALTLLPWLGAWPLANVEWTEKADQPLDFVTVQGDIPQIIKWDPDHLRQQLTVYLDLTEPFWNKDLILWPETAIPLPSPSAGPIMDLIEEKLAGKGNALVTGIPWYGFSVEQGRRTYHNSMVVLGNGSGYYHKQRLVPFGEYVPLQDWLRGLIAFFDLPMSEFSRGPADQQALQVAGHDVVTLICYEIAYPDFAAREARHSDYLITVSNDAWFGDSIGPLQHLQIARMRALETGRYLLRGTNNGVTALVDPRGRVTERAPRFERTVMEGQLYPVTGMTPFMITTSWPVLGVSLLLVLAGAWQARRGQDSSVSAECGQRAVTRSK
ncbi:apolipoprotein N-acyltransferase [Marinobacteraceae bacterium S3BR75-40.1]